MSDGPDAPAQPLRVEQALRLVPDVQALGPLRALIGALSRPDRSGAWNSGAPYRTVGKHLVDLTELRPRLGNLLDNVRTHVASLYEATLDALDAHQRGEPEEVVAALLRAAEREESVGRYSEARRWCDAALPVGDALQNRRAETAVLQRLGRLCLAQGHYAEAGRNYQRAFTLAEAEFDQAEVIDAAEGLGHVALAQATWAGAHAWYGRALRLAEAARDAPRVARLQRDLATVALNRGDLTAAREHLARARETFESLGDAAEMVRVMSIEGQINARQGSPVRASGAFREALAWSRREGDDPDLEVGARLSLAELYLGAERYLEAEEEIRRAERLAVAHNFTRRLVEIYALLGKARGHQQEETGFVFFEKALELCRTLDGSPALTGQVYYDYAIFRERVGQPAEARALLEQARACFEPLGEAPELERVRAELGRLSA